MKKRIFAIALCLCLLAASLPVDAMADNPVSFISINDTLPPELINCYTYYGGAIYVPAWIFAAYGFGIYFSYSAETNTAALYSGNAQLNFNMSTGRTYDNNGNEYTLSGIMLGGTVYVPLSYASSFFGSFSYSTMSTQYGTVLRIKDSRVVLSDPDFLAPAMSLLKQYYNYYNQSPDDGGSEGDTGSGGEETDLLGGTDILVAFTGLPSDEGLDILDNYGIKACFFLTAEQVKSDPDRVRRLAGEGHRLGVLWDGDGMESFERTAALIFEAARVSTVLVASSKALAESCDAMAGENSLVHFAQSIEALYGPEENITPYMVTSSIEVSYGIPGLALLLNVAPGMENTLSIVLNYLYGNQFDVFYPSEILY